MRAIFIIILTLSVFSCKDYACHCEKDPTILEQNDSIINTEWENLEGILNAYNEPILQDLENESYRFLISGPYDNYLKIYRIELIAGDKNLTIKHYVPNSSYMGWADSLINEKNRILTELEWSNLQNSIDENCFWTLPVLNYVDALDGITYIIEGFNSSMNLCTNTDYHFTHRYSPDSSSIAFIHIAEQIMSLDSFDSSGY